MTFRFPLYLHFDCDDKLKLEMIVIPTTIVHLSLVVVEILNIQPQE